LTWIPRPSRECDLLALQLGPEEGFVLSRIDGSTDLDQLALVTGLTAARLGAILGRLVREGAVEAPHGAARAAPSPPAPAPAPPPAPPPEADPLAGLLDDPSDSPPEEETPEHVEADSAAGSPRQLFETRLHPLPEDTRAGLAGTAVEPELSAFCFDPVPQVIARVLSNPRCGLAHARLISAHHRNAVGFEALAARPEFLHDGDVQRFLLRNPQTPAHLLRSLLLKRRLSELYRVGHDREASERTRGAARELLRERFAKGSPEERAELIIITEGRALVALSGLSLDGRTTALLCARPPASTLLIENLARWPATPPTLIAHLLTQPMVLRSPQLRTVLKRHPNAPRSPR
jgi:hypothetical protein